MKFILRIACRQRTALLSQSREVTLLFSCPTHRMSQNQWGGGGKAEVVLLQPNNTKATRLMPDRSLCVL